MNTQSSDHVSENAADSATGTAPAALTDLIAAGLVSHELIGDPAQIGAEAPALGRLCGLISGPIYRIDPFHYAFRAGPDDLSGRLGDLPPEEWTAALDQAMRAAFGGDAVWLNATDLLSNEEAPLDQTVLLLRAHAEAAVAAAPGTQVVINARYATETARLTAERISAIEPGSAIADRLAALEERQAEILDRLAAQSRVTGPDPSLAAIERRQVEILDRLTAQSRGNGTEQLLAAIERRQADILDRLVGQSRGNGTDQILGAIERRQAEILDRLVDQARPEGSDEALALIERRQAEILERLDDQSRAVGLDPALTQWTSGLTDILSTISKRLDAQAAALEAHMARADGMAGRLAELAALSGGPAVFQESLGLTLAEFLARLEHRSEQAKPARVPRFS